MYQIKFTHNGNQVQLWQGFESYSAANRALIDADLIIPLSWQAEIEETK